MQPLLDLSPLQNIAKYKFRTLPAQSCAQYLQTLGARSKFVEELEYRGIGIEASQGKSYSPKFSASSSSVKSMKGKKGDAFNDVEDNKFFDR